MDFLKKHYEKIILAILLLVFIGAMFYLMDIVAKMKNITTEGMTLITPAPDFGTTVAERDKDLYEYSTKLADTENIWKKKELTKEKLAGFGVVSDLFAIPGMARCGHCNRFVSIEFFSGKNCPFPDCHKELTKPLPTEEVAFVVGAITPDDPDGCGIPHTIKTKYNLSTAAEDRANVLEDMDGDGFSNLYEYVMKRDMNNARSCPPMWHRLQLLNIEKIKLPIVYKAVNKMNDNPDQKTWYFQINNVKDPSLDNTYKLGQTIEYDIDGTSYRLMAENLKNETQLTLVPVNNKQAKPIIMNMGEDVFSPEPKILFLDVGTNEPRIVDYNKPFRMGSPKTGYTTYKVLSFDREKQEVALAQIVRGKTYKLKTPITTKGTIPAYQRILKSNNGESSMDGRAKR